MSWLIISLIVVTSLLWFVMFFSDGLVFNRIYQKIISVAFFVTMAASFIGIVRFCIMPRSRHIILGFIVSIFGICLNLFGVLWITGSTINAFM